MQGIHVSPPTSKVCVSTLRGKGRGVEGGRRMRKEGEVMFDQVACVQMEVQNIVNLNYVHGYLGDEGVDKVYSCHLTPNSS